MNSYPLEELTELSEELLVEYSFVEKDWFITKVLTLLADDPDLIFSGGTSLFKAHRLIERFSEDIDFLVIGDFKPAKRKEIRNRIIQILTENGFNLINKDTFDSGRKYELTIEYQITQATPEYIRPHILIEICFKRSQDFEPVCKDAGSLLHIYAERELEIKKIKCTDPRQIFADKISALIWRIPDCNRTTADSSSQKLDNTIIRHLYDICKLAEALSIDSPELITLIESKVSEDMTRDRSDNATAISAQEYGLRTIATLKESTLWKESYQSYVNNFCLKGDVIDYEQAILVIEDIIKKFK
ncbi:nucleotidyl transferase AbiEii/AbiGii toxin family protein [Acinetobacter baumannii]|nr:nucleotidyl transferase AbiEii/AbiGii toxin family protein [Acinetobacter baumannii]